MYVSKTDLINVSHKQKFSPKFSNYCPSVQFHTWPDSKNEHSQESSVNPAFFNLPGFFDIFIIVWQTSPALISGIQLMVQKSFPVIYGILHKHDHGQNPSFLL